MYKISQINQSCCGGGVRPWVHRPVRWAASWVGCVHWEAVQTRNRSVWTGHSERTADVEQGRSMETHRLDTDCSCDSPSPGNSSCTMSWRHSTNIKQTLPLDIQSEFLVVVLSVFKLYCTVSLERLFLLTASLILSYMTMMMSKVQQAMACKDKKHMNQLNFSEHQPYQLSCQSS